VRKTGMDVRETGRDVRETGRDGQREAKQARCERPDSPTPSELNCMVRLEALRGGATPPDSRVCRVIRVSTVTYKD
jgi:hypothetical protein